MCMTPNIEMKTETVLLKIRNILMIVKRNTIFHLNDTFLFQGLVSNTTKPYFSWFVLYIKDMANLPGLSFLHHCFYFPDNY